MTLLIIDRDVPGIGSLERDQLRGAVARSKDTMRLLGPDIRWAQSYVSDGNASISQATRPLSESTRRGRACL
jgi:hypothetical protein